MTEVDLAIRRAKRLGSTMLDLSGRGLSKVPNEVFELANLVELDLSNNNLDELDQKILNLKNLKVLNLNDNQLEQLPTSLRKLKLKKLQVENNPVYELLKGCEFDPDLALLHYADMVAIEKTQHVDVIPHCGLFEEHTRSVRRPKSGILKETPRKVAEQQQVCKDSNKDDIIFDLKNKINVLESKLNEKKEKNESDFVTTRRNWMDSNIETTTNPKIESVIKSTSMKDFDEDNESRLQKEIQKNKRLTAELERIKSIQQNIGMTSNISSNISLQSNDNINSLDIQEINYEELNIGEKIGQGGFAIIYRAEWLYLPVSVKLIFDPNVTDDLLDEFNNELRMLSRLRHPNIINLIGASTKKNKLSIITEYMDNGNLFEFLHQSRKEIDEKMKLNIIRSIARAMFYIHHNNIVHRDLKSHNVLLDRNLNVKLCDFGLAKHKDDLNLGNGKFAGTPAYMAPELYLKRAYDEKVDVFAFGTLVWEVLVRKIPYEGLESQEIRQRVTAGDALYIPRSVENSMLSKVIEKCRDPNASKRPSFEEILTLLN